MAITFETNLTPEGRLLIPASMRRAAGLVPGSKVRLVLRGEEVVVVNPVVARKQLHDLFSKVRVSLADELLADRRAEAHGDSLPKPRPSKRAPRSR
jgi:bifunctional DNA-binding transcriptional regulator/antitoxin component of YhaV-PrlF toxin-antitoxin module